MNLDEKLKLLEGASWWQTYQTGDVKAVFMSDGPHGLRVQKGNGDHLGINASETSLSYPTESTIACSFDKDLLYRYGNVYGREASTKGVDMILGPGVNVKRNPLCGRNFEYYSEDQVLSGKLGASFVRGVQETGTSCCVKHYCCNNIEYKRNYSDSILSLRALHEVYLKPFEIIIKDANPASIMCSYNTVNGVKVSDNRYLLHDVLRDEFKYEGLVVSDWGAVNQLDVSIKAGLDLAMPKGKGYDRIKKAYDEGEISDGEIDEAANRVIAFSKRAEKNREIKNTFSKSEGIDYSREALISSAVLLKNDGSLPINRNEKILVVGEIAKYPRSQGAGSSSVNSEDVVSLLNALDKEGIKYDYQEGYCLRDDTYRNIDVKGYDKVIYALGNRAEDESEGYDRSSLSLPNCINKMMENSLKQEQKAIVLLFVGSSFVLPFIDKIDSLLLCGLPGEYGMYGIVDLLVGKTSPSGKLTETWLKDEKDSYCYSLSKNNGTTVEYSEGVFVGYKYYENKGIDVLFPFGYGLSYTDFKYRDFNICEVENRYKITCKIKNVGKVKGKEAVQLYVRYPLCDVSLPIKSLLDFIKVELEPNEEKEITFEIDREDLSTFDKNGKKRLLSGNYTFDIAKSSQDVQGSVSVKVKGEKKEITLFTVTSDIWEDERKRKILNDLIISKLLPAFGLKEMPEATLKILIDMPLKTFTNIVPGLIKDDLVEELLIKLNEVD